MTTCPLSDSLGHARKQPEILISGGDPAGIGPECLQSIFPEVLRSRYPVRYFCTASDEHIDLLRKAASKAGISTELLSSVREGQCRAAISIFRLNGRPLRPGKVSGRVSFYALQAACEYSKTVPVRGLLTLPLSKEYVIEAGHKDFSGHTGYLKDFFAVPEVVMLMHGRRFSVIPLTEHVALRRVSEILLQRLQRASLRDLLIRLSQKKVFAGRPIVICGLNPHAGENGKIGSEEILMRKVLLAWRKVGLRVDGPLSADALFAWKAPARLVLACYHDQGLIPFKALEGENGVNATIGLPFLRTSPDHGPAYDIAGQGLANPSSTRAAWQQLVRRDALWN